MTENITDIDFLSNFKSDYYSYGMDVIKNRALPDVRDGLKPVQRAILINMLFTHNTSKNQPVKVARITGDVIGNWHPHGDTSVADALSNMAAEWRNTMPAIDVEGNNGSVYGDPHAAARYIEARLTPTGDSYGENLREGVVPYEPNFDETRRMPKVLPAQLPYLLINGTEGIAVGLASSIPTHNPVEVIKAFLRYANNPSLTVKQLMTTMKGPDFPTAGIITNKDDLSQIYEHGLGKIRVRGRMRYTEKDNSIHIYEIPYNFAGSMNNLVEELAKLFMETKNAQGKRVPPKVKGVISVADHSGKDGLDIQIKLSRGTDPECMITQIYAKTRMETTVKFDMSALNDKRQKRYNLKSYFKEYLAFQHEIVVNEYKLKQQTLNDRLEIIKGMLILKTVLPEVIDQAQRSNGKKELVEVLTTGKHIKGTPVVLQKTIKQFKFSSRQAEYIASLPIYRLNKFDYDALKDEGKDITKQLKDVTKIIEDKKARLALITKRHEDSLKKLKGNTFKRHTEIVNMAQARSQKIEVPETKLYFTIDKYGYLRLSEKKMGNAIQTTNKNRITFLDENGIAWNIFLDETKPTGDAGVLVDTLIDAKDPIVGFTAKIHDKNAMILYVFEDGHVKLTYANKFMTKTKTRRIKSSKTKAKIIKVIDWPSSAKSVTLNGKTFDKDKLSVQGPSGLGRLEIDPIKDDVLDIKFK